MRDSLSHCGEFAESIQALLSGQAGYQVWSEDREVFFHVMQIALLLLCTGDARGAGVQGAPSKLKEDECGDQVKPGSVVTPCSAARS